MNRYPFCLFRIPENGGRVLWEITNTCNYHCSYCIFSSEAKKYEDELKTDEVKRAIKELKENNFTYIKFTGGEPFTRKDMTEILKYANKLGFDMDISTNASLITDEIAKELKNINFPMVHVSLDGNDKTLIPIRQAMRKPTNLCACIFQFSFLIMIYYKLYKINSSLHHYQLPYRY